MPEHLVLAAMLVFVVLQVAFVAVLTYRALRRTERIEGITAAIFLEARRVLSQYRP